MARIVVIPSKSKDTKIAEMQKFLNEGLKKYENDLANKQKLHEKLEKAELARNSEKAKSNRILRKMYIP